MNNKEPSENTSKIYRQILRGVKKNETDISLTKEESLVWDKIESEIKEARQKNPDVIFDIPWDGDFVAETKEEYSIPKIYYKLPSNFESLSEKDKNQIVDNILADMIGWDKTKFRVYLTIGSLYGESFGQDSFNIANEYLKKIHKKRPLKCWTRMCQACRDFESSLDDGFDHHHINSSVTHIKEINKLMSFTWNWLYPDGDFSKENGKPDKYFKQLIESDSKPVCRVIIQSDELLIKALNAKKRKGK